jgi:hypothetical protein
VKPKVWLERVSKHSLVCSARLLRSNQRSGARILSCCIEASVGQILNRGKTSVKGIYKRERSKKKQPRAPRCHSFAGVSLLFSPGNRVRRCLQQSVYTLETLRQCIHTASLANLLECLLHWSPSVLAHIFFSGHLVDCGINCVSGDLATSVLPGTEDDSKGGSVTSDGGSSADCVGLSNCVGWSIGVEDGIHLRPSIEPPARPPQNEFQASSLCLRLAEAHLVNS